MRIPPSAQFMFGGDHSQLAKVVELMKDLLLLLTAAASPHLRTSPGLGVAKEAEPGKVEVA